LTNPINENQFFQKAVSCLCENLSIETAFIHLMAHLRRHMPADILFLELLDLETLALITIAAADDGKSVRPDLVTYIPKDLFRRSYRRLKDEGQQIQVFNRLDMKTDFKDDLFWPERKDQSFIVVDLDILEDGKRAVFIIQAFGWDKFNDSHTRLISLLYHPVRMAAFSAVRQYRISLLGKMLAERSAAYPDEALFSRLGLEIIGSNTGLKDVMRQVRQVASVDSPVLILGETGVGKELVANAIHQLSGRSSGPFIKVNAGAIPDTLIDSELFGHEKGAFTGALTQKKGRFERAHTGTLFLDEIGELPLHAQVRMLRVLQNRIIERVGGAAPIFVDVRVLSATNRNLTDMIRRNAFREDLFYRLNVFPIIIPPLRHRSQDIPSLVQYFVKQKCIKLKIQKEPTIRAEDIRVLKEYPWPGNIRELENLIERSLIHMKGKEDFRYLKLEELTRSQDSGPAVFTSVSTTAVSSSMDEILKDHIAATLALTRGKIHGKNGAAEKLGMNPNTLRSRMRKLGIPFKKDGWTPKNKAGASY